MLDTASTWIFVSRKILFNRDVFRNTSNVIFKTTTINIFYLFQLT